jgi:uracil DNA glycosylase
MASVRLERDQHIIYVKHNFMLSGLKARRAILSAEEHKLILPISPQPYFCQKIFYLNSNFSKLNILLTEQDSENFCNTRKYFAPLEAKSVQKFERVSTNCS